MTQPTPPKFTFKTEKPTGKWRSFSDPIHHIKLGGKEVGHIDCDEPYKIRLMVIKANPTEDKNPNRPWKWIKLIKKSDSLDEAKEFLNENIGAILTLNLYKSE